MAARKSYIEIGWRIDRSGLNEANRLTDGLNRAERAHKEAVSQTTRNLDTQRHTISEVNSQTESVARNQAKASSEARRTATNTSEIGSAARNASTHVRGIGTSLGTAEKHTIRIRDIFKGTLIAGAAYSGVSMLSNGLKGLYQEANENAKAWQTFNGNLLMLGQSRKQIASTKADLQDFAVKTIYNASDMAQTYSQLAATGTKNTDQLVKGFAGLASSAQDPQQAMRSLSQQATQMAALPKVQWEDLRIMMQQAPAGISAVARSMGESTGKMIQQVHASKLSTQDFLAAIAKVGTDKSFSTMATHYKTVGQALDGLRENLANQSAPAFNRFNKIATAAVSDVNDSLSGVGGKKLAKQMDPFFDGMENFISYMQKNGKYFFSMGGSMASITGSLAKGAWTSISSMINILAGKGPAAGTSAKSIADSMNSIAHHKTAIQTIGSVMATYFVASKMLAFAKSLREVAVGFGLVRAAEAGTGTGAASALDGLSSGSWVLGGTKSRRAQMAAKEVAPEVGSRLERYSFAGKVGQVGEKIGGSKLGGLLGGVKAVGSKIPYLDIVMAGTTLFGMNSKNSGSHIGNFAGTLGGMEAGAAGGAALGSVVPGIGNAVGGVVGGAVGAIAGSSVGKAIGAKLQPEINKVSKELAPSFKRLKGWFGDQWTDIMKGTKSFAKSFGPALKPVGKAFSSMMHSITKSGFSKAIGGLAKSGLKVLNSNVRSQLSITGRIFRTTWAGVKTVTGGAIGVIKSVVRGGMKSVKGIFEIYGGIFSLSWKKTWRGIRDFLGGILDSITGSVRAAFKTVSGLIGDIKNGLTGMHKLTNSESNDIANYAVKQNNTLNSIGSGKGAPKQSKPKISVNTGIGHAAGGAITKTQLSAVNEAGTELAYNPSTGRYRTLGNGPAFTQLKAGERVLNARDTAKMLRGGLGAGKVLPGYATGTGAVGATKASTPVLGSTKLGGKLGIASSYDKETKQSTKSLKKLNSDSKKTWKSTQSDTKKVTKSISKRGISDYDDMQKGVNTQMKQMNKSIKSFNSDSKKSWKSITSDTKKQSNVIQKNTVTDFDQMQKGVHTQMKQMDKQVGAGAKDTAYDFGSAMGKLDNYAHSAMSSAIGQLNKGFSSVNGVLGQFGGSKHVLSLAHYAQGSHGPIDDDQLAILNDAKSGPTQEGIVRGNQIIKPQGRNTIVPLQKNDEVLTGHELSSLPHFAKGTDGLKRIIENNNKAPQKAFQSDFASKLGQGIGSKLSAGVSQNDKGGSTSVGNPWYGAVWNVLSSAMSSGDAAGGPVTHSPGGGFQVTSGFGNRGAVSGGFSQHDGVDYSGSKTVHSMNTGTVQRIGGPPANWGGSNGIGESVVIGGGGLNYIYQELNGKYGSGAKILVGKGDQVKAGQAIAILGSSATHVHVGATKHPMFSIGGSSTAGWLDPRTVKSSAIKVKQSKDTGGSALTKFVKKQLAGQVKWVGKHLSDDVGSLGSMGLSGSIASRARTLAAAIKKAYPSATNAGIAAVLGNWEFESGLNPGAINPGGGASGLGQWYRGRKSALVNYAQRHHMNWKNAGAQLDYALHGDGANSSILKRILKGHGSVASLANAFSSEWERGGYNAQHVAGARKIESALKGFATGGHPATGQTVLVGENGPELARFEQPATIYSNSASNQVAGSLTKADGKFNGRSVSIKLDVHVTGAVGDGKKAGKTIGDGVVARLKTMFNTETDNVAVS